MRTVAIVGGGAAGFFAAINLKMHLKEIDVVIYEAAARPLAKVLVSGGGRCNLTNTFDGGEPLSRLYPRGEKLMRTLFRRFSHRDAYEWFERAGVPLTVQEDGCVFPRSQSAAEIVSTLRRLAQEHGVRLVTSHRLVQIVPLERGYELSFANQKRVAADIVVSTIGGSPRRAGLDIYNLLPLDIVAPVPSLFSINIPDEALRGLMGAVVVNVCVALRGTKLRAEGDMLITHWGISGPAVLKLSSYGARLLKEREYRGEITISWLGKREESGVRDMLRAILESSPRRMISSVHPPELTARVWSHLLTRADIAAERRCIEIGSKGFNRLVATLLADTYRFEGRASHREEFVTAGGVSLASIDHSTLEARRAAGLYLAGETLDVDAITGGYNLQAAWSMGFVVAESIAKRGE